MMVLVVSPDALSRRGIADLLVGHPDLTLGGEVAPAETADRLAAYPRPDVILWDLTWEESPPEDLRRHLRAGVPTVCLVSTEEQSIWARAAGAQGWISRGIDPEGMAAALRAAAAGLGVFDPDLHPGRPPPGGPPGSLTEPLTSRELEVLGLVAEGLTNRAVAARLGIRESTVKDHVNAILGKLGAQSRTEAVTLAVRLGLIAI